MFIIYLLVILLMILGAIIWEHCKFKCLKQKMMLNVGNLKGDIRDEKDLEIEVIAIECDRDHTHMFLNCLPVLSPANVMQKIKGVSSKVLREEFIELSKMPSLWTRSYFVSTAGNVCSETIKKYVEEQKTRY